MKKVLLFLVGVVALFTLSINVNAEEKVKVYMFEAGGCPWCEKQMEYFESLDSYNVKFEVIKKELFVDHDTWAHGKDYDLGQKVADYFSRKGFKDAKANGTPFVIISDVYAASTYSTSLEEYINKAYEVGDKDIVGKIERDELVEEKENHTAVIIVIAVLAILGAGGLVLVATHDNEKK